MENINVKCQTLIKMKGYVFSLLSFFLHLLRGTNETNSSEALITHAVSGAENMSSLFLPMKVADDWEGARHGGALVHAGVLPTQR